MANADNRLVWIIHKLFSRSPAYIPGRLLSIVRERWLKHSFPTNWMRRRTELRFSRSKDGSPHETILNRSGSQWHWTEADVRAIVDSVPRDRRTQAILLAEDLLHRKFAFRGKPLMSLVDGEWSPAGVSRGWIWDLNRHNWFATLGFAYRYSQDERYLQCFLKESSDWMTQHLGHLGRIPWDTPFEVASRINSWAWAHFLFLSSSGWPPEHYSRFIAGVGLLAEYLNQSIEHHCPGNHILLEGKTLALVGEAFPEFQGSAVWRRKGWNIVNRELQKQICADGVHAERSTMYHRIIAGELAELWLFCARNGLSRASDLELVVNRMADFQRWIQHGNGLMPLFGDAHLEDTYYRFSAPIVSGAAGPEVDRLLLHEPTDHNYWLLGRRESRIKENQEVPAGRAFHEGGYFIARSSWSKDADVLVWDCGSIGYEINRKHAHLDTLSFTLAVTGELLLIDPGVHEVDDNLRPLRRTEVHNTVRVDQEDIAVLAQHAEIWSPPRAKLHLWATAHDCTAMSGSHDGYVTLCDGVVVRRTIVVMPGKYWLVVDVAMGSGRHHVEQRFHISPDAHAEIDPAQYTAKVSSKNVSLSLMWLNWKLGGSVDPGIMQPSIRIEPGVAELHCGHPEVTSVLVAERFDAAPLGSAVVASANGLNARVGWRDPSSQQGWLVVTAETFRHYVYVDNAGGKPAILPGGWLTNSDFAIVRESVCSNIAEILLPASAWIQHGVKAVDRNLAAESRQEGFIRVRLEPAELSDSW